jgi:hypothetical protein
MMLKVTACNYFVLAGASQTKIFVLMCYPRRLC